jgi:murein tripeptide amidase MpaA
MFGRSDRGGGSSAPRSPVEWQTPAEASGYRTTPDYATTFAYLERLAAAHPGRLRLESFGTSGEGRDLKIAVASHDGVFDPEAIHRSGRVVLLVQNAIHAGEMDGKDACLALLRDLLTEPGRDALLRRVVLVVIPIYNVDGHERRSPYHRINQNGPEEMGWRANATNLNLNRDYLKADAPETRAFLRLFRRWRPDFFVDVHVTDGADFQYDVTFILDATPDVVPATARWIETTATPDLERRINAAGHLAFPAAVFLKDDTDPAQGLVFNENPPRFSTGRVILDGRPALLVELHMLKEYRERITGAYVLLRSLLELLDREADTLIALNRDADADAVRIGTDAGRRAPFVLALNGSGQTHPVRFLGRRFTRERSEVSGTTWVRYHPEPWVAMIPVEGVAVALTVPPPAGYIVPPQWTRVLEVLDAQGVALRRTSAAWTGTVERYRGSGLSWQNRPFEGHHPNFRGARPGLPPVRTGTFVRFTETATFPAGSAVVALDQVRSRVAIHWLEPEAPDSAVRWGLFDPVFEQKEYGDGYVLERLAREMLAAEPGLRVEFERRLTDDPAFAASPEARLEFFYDRSPWGRANQVGTYPVGRLPSLDGLPLG